MLEFIWENLSTIIIGAATAVLLFFLARKMFKDKGGCSGCSGCKGCNGCGHCQEEKKQ